MKQNKKGFTLIELLVVIAIIGLLSTLAVVALNNARQKSRDAKRVADVKQMQTAMELFYNDCNGYPVQNVAALITTALSAGTSAGGDNCDGGAGEPTIYTFLSTIPTAPLPLDYTTVCTTANGTYYYQSTNSDGTACDGTANTCASYTIAYCLGAPTGSLPIGARHATPSGM
jgi:prepilin-type N-terminal cleavage/methylation domain-containing protein